MGVHDRNQLPGHVSLKATLVHSTDLADRPCLVTGASRGIGRAVAERLAVAGASLVVCCRTAADLDDAAAAFETLGASSVVARPVNVTDSEAVRRLARDAERELGPVHAVVNNAAIVGPIGRVDEVDLDLWGAAIGTNVVGVANVISGFAPQLARRGRGRIVNVSGGGIGGPHVPGRMSAYTSSKAAVVSLTETLATELALLGITVNAIAPGLQSTSMLGEIQRGDARAPAVDAHEPPSLEPFLALVLFLLSDESDWLSGKLLSARWDTVESLRANRARLSGSSLLNLRRIDDSLYSEVDREADGRG